MKASSSLQPGVTGATPRTLQAHRDGPRIELAGEVDLASASVVTGAVEEALAAGERELVLDLSPVTLLDSTGLGALLRAAREAQRQGATLRTVCPLGGEARLVIDLSGLGKLLALSEA